MKYKVTYTLFSEQGAVVDSNADGKPLAITPGKGHFIPYVEEKLLDLNTGDEVEIPIPSEKGFGEHRESLVKKTAKSNLPPQWHKVGTLVELEDDLGAKRCAKVVESLEDTVTLDFNHPFAGQNLICSIKLVHIET